MSPHRADLLATARTQVLEHGRGLDEDQVLDVLTLSDDDVPEVLELAHQVRMRWCGPDVEVEGIVSVKTGGCPEDCHFCSQSGQFSSPVRAVWLDIPELVRSAVETAATGATEFCIVAAVRGPDARLMAQMRDGVSAIRAAVDINVAASLGMLSQEQVDELAEMGVHRYNHNLETARSYFPSVVTTYLGGALGHADHGPRCRHGGVLRRHRRHGRDAGPASGVRGAARRARSARGAAELPQPAAGNPVRRPARDLDGGSAADDRSLRLALPRTILRYAGGREIALGDEGTRDGLLGGVNAVIVGNYLTTLGRPPQDDLALLDELHMPIKALSATL